MGGLGAMMPTIKDRNTKGIEMFDFEWTGTNSSDDEDRKRGIAAALTYCADNEIDPAKAYADHMAACAGELNDHEANCAHDLWGAIETAAFEAMFKDWASWPDNCSLVWMV